MKPDPKLHGRYIEGAKGIKLFVEEAGDPSKPSILWIHGILHSRLSWKKQFESELDQQFHLVRMDIRGHGLSEKPDDVASYQASKLWADDVQAVITSCGLKKPIVCAWSYAGYILCDYLRYHGEDQLGGVIFVNAPTGNNEELVQQMSPDFQAAIPGIMGNDFTRGISGLQTFVETMTYQPMNPYDFCFFLGNAAVTKPMTRVAMNQRHLDNADVLEKLTLPTQIIHGQDDVHFPPRFATYIANHVPHAKRIDYANCGHMPFFEMAERFNQDVADFVNSVNRPPAFAS